MNQEHMDSISLEIHMCLEMKAGSVWPNVLWFIWPQNIPLPSLFLPSESFRTLLNVELWLGPWDPWNMEWFEFLECSTEWERAFEGSLFQSPCPSNERISHDFLLFNGVKLRQGCDIHSVTKLTTSCNPWKPCFLQWIILFIGCGPANHFCQ